MRTLVIVCLMLSAAACFAQSAAAPSVVVGQNADGQDTMVQIIPLKFLDPVVAAELLAAFGYPGTVIPVSPTRRPGESVGAYQNQGNGSGYGRSNSRSNRGNSRYGNSDRGNGGNGYDTGNSGYRNDSGNYPGGQSSYGYR